MVVMAVIIAIMMMAVIMAIMMMVVVAEVIPTGSLLLRLRQVQPCCADIQVFIGCAQLDVSSRATHLDAQDELINGLIN